MKRFENFMRWMNVLVIFSTFFSYLAPFAHPTYFWPFSFFGLVYPWLLLANILFVFYWGILKKKYVIFSLGCIILGWGHVTSFLGFNSFDKIKTEEAITVGSYNIYNLNSLIVGLKSNQEKEKKANEFIQFLKRENEIQILCTQETSKYNIQFIKEKFNFPYIHNVKYKSPVIFSKYPIFNSGIIDFAKNSNSCLWADIKIKTKIYDYTVFIFNQIK